jgi:predicted flap endonuclease-1-like 5' DNA nuclease
MRNSLTAAVMATEAPQLIPIDDLTRISGIAEAREQKLYGLGIYTFTQLVEADPVWLAGELGALVKPNMVEKWQAEAATFGGE